MKWSTKYNNKVVDTAAQVQGAGSVRHNITKTYSNAIGTYFDIRLEHGSVFNTVAGIPNLT